MGTKPIKPKIEPLAGPTIRQLYAPAMEVRTHEEAEAMLKHIVKEILRESPYLTERRALLVARTNLGYYAGYYNDETRERVERLFSCEHPIFGRYSEKGSPTPEEAFKMGLDWAQKDRTEKEDTDEKS